MSNTIADFFVALGFDIDEGGKKKVVTAVNEVDQALEKHDKADKKRRKERQDAEADENKTRVKQLREVQYGAIAAATAITTAVGGMAAAFQHVSKGYDNLYYTSKRTGASVQNIKAFQYAVSQLGGTAEGALGSLENFTERLRSNPGLKSFVDRLGVNSNGDSVDVIHGVVDALQKKHPGDKYFVQKQLQEMLGLDEKTVQAIMRDTGKFRAQYDKLAKEFGLNSEAAAESAKNFQQTLRELSLTFEIFAASLVHELTPAFSEFAQEIGKWIKDPKNREGIRDAIVEIGRAVRDVALAFRDILVAIKPVWEAFDEASKKHLGQSGVVTLFQLWLAKILLVNSGLGQMMLLLTSFAGFRMPVWLLGLLGLGGAAAAAAAAAIVGNSLAQSQVPGLAQNNPATGLPYEGPLKSKSLLGQLKEAYGFGAEGGSRGPVPHGARVRLGTASQRANAAAIIDELQKAGLSREGIAASLGSMQTESSFSPTAHNDIKGGHTGLIQWDRNRWPKIAAWIKQRGGDPFDVRWQTRAYVAEGRAKPGDPLYDSRETSAGFRMLEGAKDIGTAVRGIRLIERFGPGEEGGRGRNAADWLPKIPTVAPIATPSAPGQSSSINMPQSTNITVHGANDPQATALMIQRRQEDVNGKYIRAIQTNFT